MYKSLCMYVCMCVCAYAILCICIHSYMSICIYANVCIRVYICNVHSEADLCGMLRVTLLPSNLNDFTKGVVLMFVRFQRF